MPNLDQVLEILNKRIKHTFLVIYKDGREQKMTGYELKQKLLAGEIRLDGLKDIQDLTYLEQKFKRIKPMPTLTRKDLLKKIGVKRVDPLTGKSYYENADQEPKSEFSTFLKLLAGLVVLAIILKSITRR